MEVSMQYVRQIEETLKEWYKDLPHLPKAFTKWLANNIWWLTLIGVVFGGIAALGSFSIIGVGSAYVAIFAPVISLLLIGAWLWLIALVVVVVIEAMAVSPLKALQRRGWELLFLAIIVSTAAAIVSGLLRIDVGGIVFSLVSFAVGAYILLEIEAYFVAKATNP